MTGPHPRRVIGYPVPSMISAGASVAVGATSTTSLPGGPGELLVIGVWNVNSYASDYYNLGIIITVDGVAVFNGMWRDLLLIYIGYNAHGLFSSSNIQSASDMGTSFACKIPYQSTLSVGFKNNGTNALLIYPSYLSRRGS